MDQEAQNRRSRLSEYVDSLQSQGRYTFTKAEASKTLSCGAMALTLALNRLAKKRRIAMVRGGFYVVVPHEYTPCAASCHPTGPLTS
jgi:hypothetical protein